MRRSGRLASDTGESRGGRTAELSGTLVGEPRGRRIGMGHQLVASGRASSSRRGSPTISTGKGLWLSVIANQDTDRQVHRHAGAKTGPAFDAVAVPAASGAWRRRRHRVPYLRRQRGRQLCVHAEGVSQTKSIVHQAFRTVADLHVRPRIRSERRVQLSGHLVGSLLPGQRVGWGLELAHEGDIIFAHVVHVRPTAIRRCGSASLRRRQQPTRRPSPTAARSTEHRGLHLIRCPSIPNKLS